MAIKGKNTTTDNEDDFDFDNLFQDSSDLQFDLSEEKEEVKEKNNGPMRILIEDEEDEDEDNEDGDESEDSEETDKSDDTSTDSDADEEDGEESNVVEEKDTKSRAKERIRELNARAIQSEETAAKNMLAALTEREEKLSIQKEMSERFVGQMEEDLKAIQELIQNFTELGDTAKVSQYQQRYMDRKAELAVAKPQVEKLNKEIDNHKKELETAKESLKTGAYKRNVNDGGKNYAAEWDKKNPWYAAPVSQSEHKKKELTGNVFKRLLQEGYDLNDPDTYKELDKRVATHFKGVVQSKSKTTSSGQEDSQTLKKKTSNSVSNQQKVLGKTRPYTQGISVDPQKRTIKVSLSSSEKETARQLGISEQEYAVEKFKLAQNEKGRKN